ncbi:hypothetical protein [Fodinibius sediminis]|uniref:Uncharacterized protein n=1 Tax=Fodinibius sediminis TaxID=1214077 RepID=A0A521B9H3_9BACT|nr:hypothetical protein [Fodinibius sediminis]SMO43713.1 hypothetical protein SAMN06265218_102326 [Fodinibius sediminis]
MADQYEAASAVKKRYEENWLKLKGVTAVGIGMVEKKRTGIIVSVSEDKKKIRTRIPAEIDGVAIQIVQTGTFKAQ